MDRRLRHPFPLALLAIALIALAPMAVSAVPGADGKVRVENLNDLPVHTYAVEGSVSELMKSAEWIGELRASVRANTEATLDKYHIEDAATLQRMYGVLLTLDMLDGNYDKAPEWITRIQELEEKEALRLTTGLTSKAIIAGRQAGEFGTDAYRKAFAMRYDELLRDLPWDVVQDRIQASKGQTEIVTANLLAGIVQSQIDPVVAQSNELSSDMAERVLGIHFTMEHMLPLREERLAVLQKIVDENRVEKENIWPAREVMLAESRELAPVMIGIWDSGIDAEVFGDLMFTNANETLDGRDNDGNGYVDDIHGIAYGLDGKPTPDILHPHGDQAGRVDAAMGYVKGLTDLQAAVDSKAATELKQHIGSLAPDEVEGFITSLGFTGLYAHGTHVAGIAAEGNPFARLLAARITFDYHSLPKPVTKEIAKRHAQSYYDTVDYFQTHGVRVANMSWGWTFTEIEQSLEANGIGDTAEERKEMTKEIFGILEEGLHGALKKASDILFVSAAGNDNSDVEFDRVIPSSYELPNLMIVGAVDQAGERTGFTSVGENVQVYANGFEVMSYVPGGDRMAMSGTSMASPNVANLAGKLFAVRPSLTPPEVIELIQKGADRLESQPDLLLINPRASIALVEGEL